MPYSSTMFCVSPSSVGNYAAKTSHMIADDNCGARTLTVLNSWDMGNNAITQSVSLPAGTYRLLLDMKYECANETSNDGKKVTTANNTNTSLTGVAYNGITDYRYPSARSQWEVMVYDFTLDNPTDIVLSLGYGCSASQGAANNTLLYIDNLRLLQKTTTGITNVSNDANANKLYNLAGQQVSNSYKGVVVSRGKKAIVK